MKKITFLKSSYLIIFAFIICSESQAQIYTGNLSLSSQAEVDAFNYTEVTGGLFINGSDVGDLTSLSSLIIVGGSVDIVGCGALTNLSGLENLASVGGSLFIQRNEILTSLSGIKGITSLDGFLVIDDNAALNSLEGFENLTTVEGSLSITNNAALTSLEGFESLTSVVGSSSGDNGLYITDNPKLISLSGLENLISVSGIFNIARNEKLINLSGLENLTYVLGLLSITDNVALTSLEGFESLTSVVGIGSGDNGLFITDNSKLISLSGLENLISVSGIFNIARNEKLTSLSGLENFLGGGELSFSIIDNVALTNLAGLENIEIVFDLDISNNDVLTNLTGLESLFIGNDLLIANNNSLTSLSGLANLDQSPGNIVISNNDELTNLEIKVSYLTSLEVFDNDALTSLEGLDNLLSVQRSVIIKNNDILPTLEGLENLHHIGENLEIWENISLSSYCFLYELIYGGGLKGSYLVGGNAVNPSQVEIIEGGSCTPIYTGDLTLSQQSEVNAFSYTEVTGQLNIGSLKYDNISDLTPLSILTSVGESLSIINCNYLTSLAGLENLTNVFGGFNIESNYNLISLSGLENLAYVEGGLSIEGNSNFISLSGLENLSSVTGGLIVSDNRMLNNLTGLENITSVGGNLIVSNNSILTSLAGLENITSVGSLAIRDNELLTSLIGLENITSTRDLTIYNNDLLTSLTGLENITSTWGLDISRNDLLTSLTGLENITSVPEFLSIHDNAALTSLAGLQNITTAGTVYIYENDVLTDLKGLDNITSLGLGALGIYNNNLLTSFCALYKLINEGGLTVTNYNITGNAINPTQQQIIDSGPCILNVYIPDANFEQALIDLDIDSDGIINQQIIKSDTEGITTLDVSDPENNDALPNVSGKINDLTGIEVFTDLTTLICSKNQLSNLDISKNILLKNLRCDNNELTDLNTVNNSELELLHCFSNQIESLNVSNNNSLVYLITHFNNYNSIDISSNTELYSFTSGHNPIQNLDVTNNTKLEYLACNDLLISELDLSQNLLLDVLYCIENPNLFCIKVANESENHPNWDLDDHTILSNNCSNNTQLGNLVLVPLSPNLLTTVQYESVVQSGNTTLEIGQVGPEIPDDFAFGDPVNYFNIETTATFTGAIEIAIYFGGMTYIKEDELRIMHYETDDWVDVTTSVDLDSKTIYGEVFSLSPFVVVEFVNAPPVAVCQNITAPADENCQAIVTAVEIDNGSTDPDEDELSFSISPEGPYDIGVTDVTLTVTDAAGNTDNCTAIITVEDSTAPVPDLETLEDIVAECEVTELTPPTATDNCSGTITATHDASLPISGEGTAIITWTYDDGNGNTSTQEQNVIINDVTVPVPDVAVLPDLEGKKSVDMPDPPIATDNCGGIITGTTDAIFPITEKGLTIITWTYDDGNGNTAIQTQNVIVNNLTPHEIQVNHYPNPFSESITFAFEVPNGTNFNISIYHQSGYLMAQLTNGVYENNGYKVIWNANATNDGVYFYKLLSNGLIVGKGTILKISR